MLAPLRAMSAAVLTSVTSTIQQSPARSAQLASAASTSAAALRELFELPEGEMLVGDFSCAIERTILLHGRAYLTQSFLCFASNIFGFETKVVLPGRSSTRCCRRSTRSSTRRSS